MPIIHDLINIELDHDCFVSENIHAVLATPLYVAIAGQQHINSDQEV